MQTASKAKATTNRKLFGRTTSIETEIVAPPERIWELLTDAKDFTRWNSTLISMPCRIEPGGRIELVAKLAPKRTFKLKVKEFEAPRQLAWGDAMGTRVYRPEPTEAGTRFSMQESIGGPIVPLFAKMLPALR